ncbi:unnamed protein product [Dicrocoelium dendriticum]|nr:unnamed protein product [Dicrocoelium dendriticum]
MCAQRSEWRTRWLSTIDRIRENIPELIPHPPPIIQDYGDLPYFHPCRLGKREPPVREQPEPLDNPGVYNIHSLLPRGSVGARSQDLPHNNFRWLLNKKFTCVFMWFGIICLIVGVIALQIASFFRHKRQAILSTGVGCLSGSLCLLTISMFSFLHAHCIIYEWDPDKDRIRAQQEQQAWELTPEGQRLSVWNEMSVNNSERECADGALETTEAKEGAQ